MTDMTLALTLTADASGLVGAVKRGKGELEGLGQSAKAAGASAQTAAGGVSAMEAAAQGAAQKTGHYRDAAGRLRDENGKFVKSGSEAAAAARSAAGGFAQAGSAAGAAAGGVGVLRAALSQIAGSVRSANDSVGGLVSSVRGLGAVVVGGFALDQIKDFAVGAVEVARGFEQIRTRLEFVAGSQALANAEMARARKLADDMAVSERSVLDIRARMIPLEQAGAVSRQHSLAMTTGLIDATKALGVNQDQLGDIMYGLGQALSQAIVRAEEYNQVVEPLPSITLRMDRAVQQMTGNASANFRQMINDGQVTRDLFATVLVKALEDFEGAGEKSANTLDGAIIAAQTSVERFKDTLINNGAVISALRGVSAAVDDVNRALGGLQDTSLEGGIQRLQDRLHVARMGGHSDYVTREQMGTLSGWGEQIFGISSDQQRKDQEELNRLLAEQGRLRQAASYRERSQSEISWRTTQEAQVRARLEATEAGKREKALADLAKREAELADWRARGIGDAEALERIEAQITADRAKLDEAGKPKGGDRDRAAEAEAALSHARTMAQAAQIRDDAERRSAEIAALAEEAARRSGYDPATQSGEYARVREAEAERLRLDDAAKAAEEGRRRAAQKGSEAEREKRRLGEQALRDQEAALKKLADLDAEAAASAAALGAARQAASEAATATTLEGLAEIEARAEEAKRRLAVKEAGDKAFESLDKGATEDQRKDARAQAEATEAAKQQADLEEKKLQTAATLLSLRLEESRGAEAAARAAETARAAAQAGSLAEIAALEAQGEAAGRVAETDRKAAEARLSLGAEAGKLEREAAEAAARGLAAEEERLRLAGLLLDQARQLAELRERGAQAEARAAVALRHAAAASAARTTLELEAARKSAEAETRQLDRAEKIREAAERMGPEADPIRVAEAESLAAAEWDRTEAARQAAEIVEKRAALLRFEETAANRLADIEAQRAAYLAASGTAEERARAAQLELTVQQRIREAKAAQLPHDEAALRAGAEREASAARELDLIQRRGAALEDLGRRSKQAAEDAAAARQGPAAQTALSIRRAGEDAARPLGGDADVAAAAEGEARARLHAEAVRDLQERLRGLKPAYEAALESNARWREGALAGLDPLAEGYREHAAEVDRIFARLNEDALQHSTDYFDGVRRGLKDLEEANRDWAKTAESFTTGFAKTSEDAFVNLAKTGKFEIGSLADFVIEQMARMAYQQAIAPAVNGVAGGIANLLGSFLGGSFGGGAGAANAAAGSVKGYDAGGYTGPGAKYEPAGIVHRGEVVWSQADVARHGGAGLVEAMRRADPLEAAGLLMRAAERSGARGYAEGGIVARAPLFAAPPAAQIEALTRAAGQGAASVPASVNVVIVNETSAPIGRAERRQRPDGTLEIRLMEAARAAVAQDIASGSGPVSGALQGRYQMVQNFGGRR